MSEVASVAAASAEAAPIAAPIAQPGPAEIDALAALLPDPSASSLPPVASSTALPGAERTDATPTGAPAEEVKPAEGETAEAAPAQEATDKDALERAEAAAKRAREGSRRYREILAQQEEAKAEVRRQAAEAQRLRQEAEQNRRLREDLKKDPYAALKNLGMTDQELAERALREGTPEAALHALNERLEAESRARQALEQQLQNERQAAAQRQAEEKFYRVADNEAAYPRLAELNAKAQLVVAKAALQQIADNGYEVSHLSDEQVAEACERFLSPKKGKAAKSTPAPAAKPAPAAAKPANKTLTNAVSTEKTTATRPWHELTEEEQIAQIAASLPDPA